MYEAKNNLFYLEIDHDYEKRRASGFGVFFGVLVHVR